MSSAVALVALALPVAAAWPIVSVLTARAGRSHVAAAGRLALAFLLGAGLSSLVALAWLLTCGALTRAYAAGDALLFTGAAWLGVRAVRRHRRASAAAEPVAPRGARADRAALVVLAAALVVALACFGWLAAATPHGELDAWVIWNLRARFLVRAGDAWRAAFAPELAWSHTEYPLLVPLAVARLWAYAGETAIAPMLVAGAFTLSAPIALAAGVGAVSGGWRAALAGLVLLATPGFVSLGATQYADVPLATFLVAALGVLGAASPCEGRDRLRALALGGALLGFGGWTKNEGVVAGALVVLTQGVLRWRAHGRRAALGDVAAVAVGAAPAAAAWILFHVAVTPRIAGELFQGQSAAGVLGRLVDAERWTTVLSTLPHHFPGMLVGFPAAVMALAILTVERERSLARSQALAVAALLYGVHVATFLATSWELGWHLRMAADRVLLQPWPAVLLGLFAAPLRPRGAETPERRGDAAPAGSLAR